MRKLLLALAAFTPAGPLYGVQNSNDTGSDAVRGVGPGGTPNSSNPTPLPDPNGFSGKAGGFPLYKDRVLVETQPPLLNETMRAIPPRNAFIMDSLLQEVTRSGTAAKAQAQLKRPDIYGKTGTTNDSLDAWFATL